MAAPSPGSGDEEAQWAALEKLPTCDRLTTSVWRFDGADEDERAQQINVTRLSAEDRRNIIERILSDAEVDHERFLRHLRERLDRVDIDLPKIEVRYDHLNIEAEVLPGSKATPSLPNFFQSIIKSPWRILGVAKRVKANILSDVSGILKPRRLTLLLGPPGSGRTTFLRALGGRLSRDLQVSGEITYNGHQMNEFIPRKTSAYISQYDLHTAELTVRETLDFYCRVQGVGNRYDMLKELTRREREREIKPEADVDIYLKATSAMGQSTNLGVDYMTKLMGLDICADTPIGDAMRRGISGGQKKRVTTAEMLVGPVKAFFMDEISTGLDSSTTFQITKMLQQIAHFMDNTIVVSLLQPPPETFALFDDLILFADGQIVYQGPCSSVLDFMAHMGFRCPERKATADFLQEVTSRKDQEQYWADRGVPYEYVPVSRFVEGFNSFHVGQNLAKELAIPYDKSKSHPAALVHKRYALSNLELLKACFARELILMKRNIATYVVKMIQDMEGLFGRYLLPNVDRHLGNGRSFTIHPHSGPHSNQSLIIMDNHVQPTLRRRPEIAFIAIIAATLYLRTKMHHDSIDDATVYMGALFFTLMFVMTVVLPEITFLTLRLPVYYKEKELLLYPAWALSLPMFLLRIPWTFLEAGVFLSIIYYVTGFSPEPGRFFTVFLVLILINQGTIAMSRFAAAVGRTKVVAENIGSFIYVTTDLLGGFLLSRDEMPVWWKWASWCSILFYGQEAVSVNEYRSKEWNKPFGKNTTLGEAALQTRGLESAKIWVWISVAALLGFVILFNILFTLCFQYIDQPPIVRSGAVKAQEVINEQWIASDSFNRMSRGSSRQDIISRSGSKRAQVMSASPENLDNEIQPRPIGEAKLPSMRYNEVAMSSGLDDNGNPKGRKGMVLPFQPLSISFDNINYFVDMPDAMKERATDEKLHLIRNVSGAFRPGVLTALVGVSGAGKTTLLDVLAGRKTRGYVEGEIFISGYPKEQSTFTRIAGYCEQNDIHSPNVTVLESLIFSAWMRLSPEVDRETRMVFVKEVMSLVELDVIQDFVVGLPGVSGLSTEQRKRLTIAVELVANPSIIFMDEPTSGLDARAAAIVMRAVRNIGDTGRTVVCTIHQPSIDIFETFDELLLLKLGGETIYAGPLGEHSRHLIEYFEVIPGVPKIKEGYNPATWMMEVTSPSMESNLGVNFAEIYAKSDVYQGNEDIVKQLSKPAPESKDLEFPTVYAQPFWVQCLACLWKMSTSYWRNTTYTGVKILFTTGLGLFIGSLFWGLGKKRETQQDLFNLMGAIYGIVIFIAFNSTLTVQSVIGSERLVYYRERGAGMYSPLTYAIAQFLIEWPYNFFQSLLYAGIVYSMIQFEWQWAKALWFLFFMFFTLLYFVYYGMICVAITPNLLGAAILSTSIFSLLNLFAGFVITRKQMPIWWRWLYWCMPSAWSLYGLFASQLSDVGTFISLPDNPGQQITVKDYLRDYYGYEHSFLKYVAIEQVLVAVSLAFVFALLIKYFNFQQR